MLRHEHAPRLPSPLERLLHVSYVCTLTARQCASPSKTGLADCVPPRPRHRPLPPPRSPRCLRWHLRPRLRPAASRADRVRLQRRRAHVHGIDRRRRCCASRPHGHVYPFRRRPEPVAALAIRVLHPEACLRRTTAWRSGRAASSRAGPGRRRTAGEERPLGTSAAHSFSPPLPALALALASALAPALPPQDAGARRRHCAAASTARPSPAPPGPHRAVPPASHPPPRRTRGASASRQAPTSRADPSAVRYRTFTFPPPTAPLRDVQRHTARRAPELVAEIPIVLLDLSDHRPKHPQHIEHRLVDPQTSAASVMVWPAVLPRGAHAPRRRAEASSGMRSTAAPAAATRSCASSLTTPSTAATIKPSEPRRKWFEGASGAGRGTTG